MFTLFDRQTNSINSSQYHFVYQFSVFSVQCVHFTRIVLQINSFDVLTQWANNMQTNSHTVNEEINNGSVHPVFLLQLEIADCNRSIHIYNNIDTIMPRIN